MKQYGSKQTLLFECAISKRSFVTIKIYYIIGFSSINISMILKIHFKGLIKHKYSVYLINIKISFMSEFGDLAAFQHVWNQKLEMP